MQLMFLFVLYLIMLGVKEEYQDGKWPTQDKDISINKVELMTSTV